MSSQCPIKPFPRWVPLWFVNLESWVNERLGFSLRCMLPLGLMFLVLMSLVLSSCSTVGLDAGSTTGETQGIAKPAGALSTEDLQLIAVGDRVKAPVLCGETLSSTVEGSKPAKDSADVASEKSEGSAAKDSADVASEKSEDSAAKDSADVASENSEDSAAKDSADVASEKFEDSGAKDSADAAGEGGKSEEVCLPEKTVAIVNFWGSWCPPCLREMPDLMAVQKKYPDVFLIGINSADTKVNARQFQKEHNITFPSLFDEGGELAAKFGTMAPEVMPSTLLIDKQGNVALQIVGAITQDRLAPLVQQLLEEK